MATKKKEIYARVATQLRTNERAIKAELVCPGAMGLYLFLLLDSRGETTSGDVAEVVALASWGGKESYRAKQAQALIAFGLVERQGDRLVVLRYDEHNDTPEEIEAAKARARDRMYKVRERKVSSPPVQRTSCEHTRDVPSSCSSSISEEKIPEEIPSARARPDPSADPPPWWAGVLETLSQTTGVDLPAGEAWLAYAGHRAGKTRAATREDALYWLTTVMVPKARKARIDAADKREREAKWDQERSGPRLVAVAPAPYHAAYRPPRDDARAPPEVAAAALQRLTGALCT
jgi:hypothetical protein